MADDLCKKGLRSLMSCVGAKKDKKAIARYYISLFNSADPVS